MYKSTDVNDMDSLRRGNRVGMRMSGEGNNVLMLLNGNDIEFFAYSL